MNFIHYSLSNYTFNDAMLKLQNLLRFGHNAGGIFCRHQSTTCPNQKLKHSYLNVEKYRDLLTRRQSEALRSIIVEVDAKDVCGQVYHHCKQFGDIKTAFVYTLKNDRNLMLLEYESEDAVKETFKFSGFKRNSVNWPNRVLSVNSSKLNKSLSKDAPLQIDNAVEPPIADILRKADTFDEQVHLLYTHTCLTELSVRLKFITALQAQTVINEFLNTIFPNAIIYPFGSSVNGFGRMGCDLDMAMRIDNDSDKSTQNNRTPLVFQGKLAENDEGRKKLKGREVKCIASLIDYLVPGSTGVSAFHGAKVPIVRYFDRISYCSVDLSIYNFEGFHITEFMYAMGMLDPRIRPFIFMVRRWAHEFEVTRHNGRENFTNFQLSYMCVSFLQQLKEPLIPTFEEVLRQTGGKEPKNDRGLCSELFMFNFDRLQFSSKNTSSVSELFIQFLEYYEAYDLSTYMVTVRTTDKIVKPDPSPLYLENIFDLSNPPNSNVSQAECSSLKIIIRHTLQELEQCSTEPTDKSQDWGLLELISKIK